MNRRAFFRRLATVPLVAAAVWQVAPAPIALAPPFDVTFPVMMDSCTLSLSQAEFSRRYLAPAVDALADAIDKAAFERMMGR